MVLPVAVKVLHQHIVDGMSDSDTEETNTTMEEKEGDTEDEMYGQDTDVVESDEEKKEKNHSRHEDSSSSEEESTNVIRKENVNVTVRGIKKRTQKNGTVLGTTAQFEIELCDDGHEAFCALVKQKVRRHLINIQGGSIFEVRDDMEIKIRTRKNNQVLSSLPIITADNFTNLFETSRAGKIQGSSRHKLKKLLILHELNVWVLKKGIATSVRNQRQTHTPTSIRRATSGRIETAATEIRGYYQNRTLDVPGPAEARYMATVHARQPEGSIFTAPARTPVINQLRFVDNANHIASDVGDESSEDRSPKRVRLRCELSFDIDQLRDILGLPHYDLVGQGGRYYHPPASTENITGGEMVDREHQTEEEEEASRLATQEEEERDENNDHEDTNDRIDTNDRDTQNKHN